MRNYKTDSPRTTKTGSWRDYQQRLQKPCRFKPSSRLMIVALALLAVPGLLYVGLVSQGPSPHASEVIASSIPASKEYLIGKRDVQLMLAHLKVDRLSSKIETLDFNGHHFKIQTSLDVDLNTHLIQAMDRKNSRFIGIVVMEARTGRILSLAGFNKIDPRVNPCLESSFPAASVFKMVTAAAAADRLGLQPETPLRFNGYKHTLYQSQLKERRNQYTNTLSFKDSFAQSVNPVFGKLGILKLRKPLLEQYGDAFGFNQPIEFELPVNPSHLHIDDKPYHWAEIASGFNNDTTLSPLHAAMMASAVINEGWMVAPTIVERITDESGRMLYRSQAHWHNQAMSAEASRVLANLMETTVRSGTARKAFRGWQRDRVLSKLRIGGKTGSIFNRAHDARFDWFAGFAEAKDGSEKLTVAVLVAHEEYIGIRAASYARKAISHYFDNRSVSARRQASSGDGDG